MKLRITENSFRFRITSTELAQLQRSGLLECKTVALTAEDEENVLRFRISHRREARQSEFRLERLAVNFIISGSDLESLSNQNRESIYLEREWVDSQGQLKRSRAYVEKDRPKRSHQKSKE